MVAPVLGNRPFFGRPSFVSCFGTSKRCRSSGLLVLVFPLSLFWDEKYPQEDLKNSVGCVCVCVVFWESGRGQKKAQQLHHLFFGGSQSLLGG